MENKYMYLFPFEKIPCQAKVLLYGAGDVGQEYLQQIHATGYCKVKGFVDRAFSKYPAMIIPIYDPDEIVNLEYDYIILALKTQLHVHEIMNQLLNIGVGKNKIVYVGVRKQVLVLQETADIKQRDESFAFEKGAMSIALKYGPGLGDCIVKKKLFDELVKIAPDCLIDIYGPNISEYIKVIYGNHPNLHRVIDDGGALYVHKQGQYAVSLQVFFMIQVDSLNYELIYKKSPLLAHKLKLLQERCKEYGLAPYPVIQNGLHFKRQIYQGNNYYTAFNYGGVFAIQDCHVQIGLSSIWKQAFNNLRLRHYITVNYGNGGSSFSQNVSAKQWPYAYFNQFVQSFKEKYPHIKVIQIGAANAPLIKGVDQSLLGESLELAKYVLKNSLFHLDIEGGLVHLATQLGTKCIVLFGPTPVQFFGYEENINIVSEVCSGCCYLYDDINRCARNLKITECMHSITPEMVMEKVIVLLEKR